MELLGAIMALRALECPHAVALHTDSRYVCDAFLKGWIAKWQSNGWRTSARQPVDNQDLWLDLLELTAIHDVKWRWVAGHSGIVEHDRCDKLAVAAREELQDQLEEAGTKPAPPRENERARATRR
jgi:ribonuclease HI